MLDLNAAVLEQAFQSGQKPASTLTRKQQLADLGVQTSTSARVTAIDEEGVTVTAGEASSRIAARTVLWAAGVRASKMGKVLAERAEVRYTEREKAMTPEVMRQLVGVGQLVGFEVHERFYEFGSPAGLAELENFFTYTR